MELIFIFVVACHAFAAGLFMLIFGIHKFKANHTGLNLVGTGAVLVLISGFILGVYLYFYIGFATGLIRLM
ncbi:MAG: hypothetical protein II788_06000 [Acholeplasmatales bacterium]|nr:hypothetical protein [Acholeplasmatales bacterium]